MEMNTDWNLVGMCMCLQGKACTLGVYHKALEGATIQEKRGYTQKLDADSLHKLVNARGFLHTSCPGGALVMSPGYICHIWNLHDAGPVRGVRWQVPGTPKTFAVAREVSDGNSDPKLLALYNYPQLLFEP